MHVHPQAITQQGLDLKVTAQKHGWPTDTLFLKRIKKRMDVILKRTADCFSALTETELSAYLQGRKGVAHLNPSTKYRKRTVARLIQLRLPAPELSANPSKNLCSSLYELMARWVT